ncbi:MAG TPA: tetratricopeptide repeat protein, partial [Steroidobacteraceae bacterium]
MTAEIAVIAGHPSLFEVREQGNDAMVEILDATGQVLVRADHPERRTGIQRAVVTPDGPRITVRIAGQEQSSGSASVRAFDLDTLRDAPECLAVFRSLAAADADYALARDISTGHVDPTTKSARALYQQAKDGYLAAERALIEPGDRALRGETELALAGVEYSGLQDWAGTAEWATTASKTLAAVDSYRRARADALLAAALIEIGNAATAGHRVPGFDRPAPQLLAHARAILTTLSRFHLQRRERYDAGLQLNNISLAYLYSGQYADCVAAALTAGNVFGSIHEMQRQAVASENRALCLWGLGRLPEALALLERALPVLSTDSIPILYLGVLNNTALIQYALGHFDASLQLFDRSLSLAQQRQWRRDEAQALFGIGIDYYALGDRERALQFLERSRAKREESGDGRGRMQTLRALATVYAEQGRVADALATDQQALSLAVAPSAIERIRIQMAAHAATAGRQGEALAQLDALLTSGVNSDSLIRAEALLQRGVVLREMRRPGEALRDIAAARPGLRRLGSVMEEFQADLEIARNRRELGEPREALAAVDRALSRSDAVRQQSANPELRAQLQTPLRPAYDLKLDILRAQFDAAVAGGRAEDARRLATAAFLTADASRAQSLADMAAQSYSPAVRTALAPEFRRREALYSELAGRRFALDARLDSSGSADPRAKHLIQDISDLQRQLDTVNSVIATRTLAKAGQAQAGKPPGLPSLPDDTALVSYWIGSDFACAWVLSSKGIQWVQLAVPVTIAEQAAALQHSLRRLVDVPVSRRLQDARALYDLVIKPLAPWVADFRQWLIVPDGPLDYVPFAALRGEAEKAETFVVMHHDIAVTPAVWLLQERSTQTADTPAHGILLVADPVYQADDPRLASTRRVAETQRLSDRAAAPARGEFQRLPYTAVEARDIAAQFP